MSAEKTHPYHMVEPSKWPFLGALSALLIAVGGIWYMKEGPSYLLIFGFAMLFYTSYGWWRDVIMEANSGIEHTPVVRHGLRVGMALFIASEVMFFFAFFWAFFNSSMPMLSHAAQEVWPPEGIVPLETWHLPFINTIILLSSGATCTVAHHALKEGNHKKTAFWLALTVVLGLIFTCTQAYEYGQATFGFEDGIYSSTFYLATGFHGFHVIVGTVFLAVCMFRAMKGHFTPEQHVGFEAAAWYWHFVDVVWLFLFVTVYWWGGSNYVHP